MGFGITKAGALSNKTRVDLTNIVIYVVLPCNIFSSFQKGITPEMLRQCLIVLIAAFGMQLLYIVINKLAYIKIPPERRVVVQYATIVNNAAFMGLPIIGAVFGSTGILYGSIALIPMRIFAWTAGLSLFTDMETKQKVKILATHPCIWAVILGFAYIFAPFELPGFLSDAISTISACTTMLPMLVVGSILSGVKLKDVLDKDCFYYSLFRLILIPAVVFGALTLLRVDPLTTGVVVLASAMPASTTSAMLSEKYGKDSIFAARLLIISTILSIITLPVITEVLMRVGG